jgi:hypothetical protein
MLLVVEDSWFLQIRVVFVLEFVRSCLDSMVATKLWTTLENSNRRFEVLSGLANLIKPLENTSALK